MTPRRKETRVPTNQPVRFYKIVALSFLFLTLVLLGLIVFMSSKRATITITTKDTPIDVTLSVPVSEVGGSVSTTTVEITERFFPEGDTDVPGEAVGTMTIINDSAAPQPLVATTRFLSSGNVLFRLRSGVTVPANGSINAEVYADEEGATGNIGPDSFTIPGLNETRQKQVYGKTSESMSGGLRSVGVLTSQDLDRAKETLREKVLLEAKTVGDAGLSDGNGAVYTILSEDSEVSNEIGEEITEFSLTLTAVVAQMTYNDEEATQHAKEALERRVVDDTETVEPSEDDAQIRFGSYDADLGEANVSLYYAGVASLNPESDQLQKQMFFGKTRDEIRRYVLSLDHVHSVDISFSPAWMQTVPHVNEHLNVVIKSVR